MLRFSPEKDITKVGVDTSVVKKKGIFDVSIINHRERVARVEPLNKPADVHFFDIAVPIPGGIRIPTRVYLPPEETAPVATLFYIPGTAFVARDSKFTQVVCSHICQRARCQVIVINHRLAPENPSPTSYLDSYEVFKFFVGNKPVADHFSVDRNRIALGGYSSGGNIAALMAIQAKQDHIPVRLQVLISPIVDLSRRLTKFSQWEEQDTDISEEFVNWFLDLYFSTENMNPEDPHVSPIWRSKNELKGLPPTTIVVAEYDRFRSDAEAYYEKLTEAGVFTNRIFLDKENHSYLWHKLAIVEKIADDILRPAFHGQPIYSIATKHRLSFILPNINGGPIVTAKTEEQNKNPQDDDARFIVNKAQAKL